MKHLLVLATLAIAALVPATALAQSVAAARTIRAKSILYPDDLVVLAVSAPGAITAIADAVGKEARTILYPGRPIRKSDIGPPALVERNQIVSLIYQRGALVISADGRALARGGIGDRIRVMNPTSRTTVTGVVTGPATIRVMP